MNTEPVARRSILIIDNEVGLVNEFAERCKALGLDVITACDAREASLVFDRGLPDLLMFNINLPAGNNKTFIECLAAYEDTRDIPSILLCDEPDWDSATTDTTFGYRVHKCLENWWRVEMFIFELIDLDPSLLGNNSSAN